MDRISFNYRMIEVARLSRGVLQTELAREMDVSQSAVSKWEQGEMSLKKDQIDRLCKVLDYPETFFEQQINILPQYAIYYRKKKSAKQLDLDKIRYSLFIQKHGLKKLLKSVDLPNKVRFLGVKYDRQPADIARIIRQDWKLPVGPIQNLTKTIEKAGIIVFLVSANCDEFDGMVLPDEDGLSVICINENLSPDRFRFTLAHELAHLIMHTNFFPSDDDDFEKQANDFASEFLMPEADIGRDFFDLTTSINGFATLKPHWGVSIQSLIYRAKELGFINLAKYKSLYVQIGQKNWRKDEPPMNMKRETPVIVQQMLEVFKDKLGYSDSEIAKILSLNLTDFRNFRNTYSSVFSLKIHK